MIRKRKAAGFSLIELLLVLAIMGIISGIAIPAFLSQRRRARLIGDAQANAQVLRMQLETYKADAGVYGGGRQRLHLDRSAAPASGGLGAGLNFTPKAQHQMNVRDHRGSSRLTYNIQVMDPSLGASYVIYTVNQAGSAVITTFAESPNLRPRVTDRSGGHPVVHEQPLHVLSPSGRPPRRCSFRIPGRSRGRWISSGAAALQGLDVGAHRAHPVADAGVLGPFLGALLVGGEPHPAGGQVGVHRQVLFRLRPEFVAAPGRRRPWPGYGSGTAPWACRSPGRRRRTGPAVQDPGHAVPQAQEADGGLPGRGVHRVGEAGAGHQHGGPAFPGIQVEAVHALELEAVGPRSGSARRGRRTAPGRRPCTGGPGPGRSRWASRPRRMPAMRIS